MWVFKDLVIVVFKGFRSADSSSRGSVLRRVHRDFPEFEKRWKRCARVRVRTSKHLNHLIEHDYRRVKQRLGPMLGRRHRGNRISNW